MRSRKVAALEDKISSLMDGFRTDKRDVTDAKLSEAMAMADELGIDASGLGKEIAAKRSALAAELASRSSASDTGAGGSSSTAPMSYTDALVASGGANGVDQMVTYDYKAVQQPGMVESLLFTQMYAAEGPTVTVGDTTDSQTANLSYTQAMLASGAVSSVNKMVTYSYETVEGKEDLLCINNYENKDVVFSVGEMSFENSSFYSKGGFSFSLEMGVMDKNYFVSSNLELIEGNGNHKDDWAVLIAMEVGKKFDMSGLPYFKGGYDMTTTQYNLEASNINEAVNDVNGVTSYEEFLSYTSINSDKWSGVGLSYNVPENGDQNYKFNYNSNSKFGSYTTETEVTWAVTSKQFRNPFSKNAFAESAFYARNPVVMLAKLYADIYKP